MAKLRLVQQNRQKLSPQQLQIIGLLQISNKDLEKRIGEEMLENPLLGKEEEDQSEERALMAKEEEGGYRQRVIEQSFIPRKSNDYTKGGHESLIQQHAEPSLTLQEHLAKKFSFLVLDEEEGLIGQHIIGSLTDVGYLTSGVPMIVEELAVNHYREVSATKVAKVLSMIQELGPPGIAARDLQECLTLQLQRKKPTPSIKKALQIVRYHFADFTKKQYERIASQMKLDLVNLKPVLAEISTLHAEPFTLTSPNALPNERLEPDFVVTPTANGRIEITLIEKRHGLTIRKGYQHLLEQHKSSKIEESKKLVGFIQDKMNRAKWFIQALKKRKETLLKIMQAIVKRQKNFFQTGEQSDLHPLFLWHIAEEIDMDVSTVSRAVAHKVVQAHGYTYSLRFFFSEPIQTTDGKKVSSSVVKLVIQELVAAEDKQAPMTDDMIATALKERSYLLARRTIAKYRQHLGIPVARMRRDPLAT